MALLSRLFVVAAALSLIIGIILKLTQNVFPVWDLAPSAFLRFADTNLLFGIALLVLTMAGAKGKAS